MRLVLAMPGHEALADALSGALGGERADVQVHRFPDGECRVALPVEGSAREVVLVCSLADPDPQILPLWFAAGTLRELGATTVTLVAPYLAYMRQDVRFRPGEAVSAPLFAQLLSACVDALVTVDPHLHRIHDLSEIYDIDATVVHAAPAVARWIQGHVDQPVLVGPDEESEQWVAATAERVGCPHLVLRKVRRGDTDVSVEVPDVQRWRHHTPVLVDDIISTGRTLVQTVGHLNAAGMKPAVCVAVHGLFAGDAWDALQAAGVGRVVTCNTVVHPSNAIDIVPLLAEAL